MSSLANQVTSFSRLVRRAGFRAGARNAVYSVIDQAATPLMMLFAAPFLLNRMGLEQFGVWMLVLALTGSLSVFNFGLGDATIKFLSQFRGRNDSEGMKRTFRVNLMLGIFLGVAAASLTALAAPVFARFVLSAGTSTLSANIHAVRLGALILALRSVESVLANALKAFEDYATAAKISVCVKAGTVGSAIALVACDRGVCAMLVGMAVCVTLGIVGYSIKVSQTIPDISFRPGFDLLIWQKISKFGLYSWLQSVAAMMFSQADKLVVGALMGVAAAGRYSICAQLAAIVHMTIGSAFGFLFPQFSRRREAGEARGVEQLFRRAMAMNWTLTIALTVPMILGARQILSMWLGKDFADQSYVLLALLVLAYGWLSVNVVPYLALLGLGRIRFACLINVAAGCVSVMGSLLLIPRFGFFGAGVARIAYAAVVTMCYFEAARILQPAKSKMASVEVLE